jgi:uncharacterized protein YdeI (YjbR/CyaY-like superfamily)
MALAPRARPVKIGETFYAKNRRQWRSWLSKHHKTRGEIWLIYYKKDSGMPRVSYNAAVEEALCFGWIDSIGKPIDDKCFAQRFSPRRPKSKLSPMNRERVRRLMKARLMTRAGLDALREHGVGRSAGSLRVVIPKDILEHLKRDPVVWRNFSRFPASYKRIRIGWIDGSRNRQAAFDKRLRYFLKMTKANQRFGMVQ